MVQSLLDRFREQKSATSDEVRSDLEHEINRLRKMLAIGSSRGIDNCISDRASGGCRVSCQGDQRRAMGTPRI